MTANSTPSRMQSTAALVACLAARILPGGMDIDPDVSTITISAAPTGSAGAEPPTAVTVTTALTSVAPTARYSFW